MSGPKSETEDEFDLKIEAACDALDAKLEPEVIAAQPVCEKDAALLSIAVSLKRIADVITRGRPEDDRGWSALGQAIEGLEGYEDRS